MLRYLEFSDVQDVKNTVKEILYDFDDLDTHNRYNIHGGESYITNKDGSKRSLFQIYIEINEEKNIDEIKVIIERIFDYIKDSKYHLYVDYRFSDNYNYDNSLRFSSLEELILDITDNEYSDFNEGFYTINITIN
jgi:hypothetical protein